MKNSLKLGAIAALLATSAFAGGIGRSGQGVGILFEEGRVMSFGVSVVQPDVTGTAAGFDTGNAAADYTSMSFGYKADVGNFSYALIYDEPFGADTAYPAGNPVVGGLTAELNSNALTLVGQYNFNERISVYGGLRAQNLNADLVNPFNSYAIQAEDSLAYGYLLGAAYEIPEIALRLDLTYNSSIEHKDIDVKEDFTHPVFGPLTGVAGKMNLVTPRSLNLNFQTGINESTLVFGGVRWVDWSEFDITAPVGGELVSYDDDVYTYTIGAARKINETFSVAGSFSYEAADDSDATFLAPTNGRSSVSLAGIYTVGNSKIQAGVSYIAVGDAETAGSVGTFKDNSALGFGIKLTQSF